MGMAVYDAVVRGECSEAEAERLVRSFLSAGVDTTVSALGNMLYAFCNFPDQWRRLREQPSLARKAIEESLRWDSAVQTFFRTTTRDVEIDGMVVRRAAKSCCFWRRRIATPAAGTALSSSTSVAKPARTSHLGTESIDVSDKCWHASSWS